MEKNHATPILASYVTYKELSSHGNYKSPYQILAEFIKYIIYEKKLYAFSIGEIKSRVENEFEFYLPDAVWACGHFFRPLCLYSFYNLED